MNRRDFIKAGAGAFFIASAPRVFGAMAPSNRVRLAIVGCREGGRGMEVVRAAMLVPGLEIAVVCGPSAVVAKECGGSGVTMECVDDGNYTQFAETIRNFK